MDRGTSSRLHAPSTRFTGHCFPPTDYIYSQPNMSPGFMPWRPGANVYMAAIYRLNITLTYMERRIHRTMSVEGPPWWTVEACFQERLQTGVKVMGKPFDEENFGLCYRAGSLVLVHCRSRALRITRSSGGERGCVTTAHESLLKRGQIHGHRKGRTYL